MIRVFGTTDKTFTSSGDGYVRITCPGGKVMDERTGRKYRKVECRERDAWHFVGV